MSETLIGLTCCISAGLLFGSQFSALKKHYSGDGFFVQWIQCSVMFVSGLIVNLVRGQPRFEPGASLGGFLFATATECELSANACAIPLVNHLGAGSALLIVGSIQTITGWATARFGLFGLKVQMPTNPMMNYIGVALILISALMFAFVKNESNGRTTKGNQVELVHSNGEVHNKINISQEYTEKEKEKVCRPKKWILTKLLYLPMTIFAGIVYGEMLSPTVYVQDNVEGASQEGLDYVFSHMSGAFAGSTIYFIIYGIIKRNRPFINPETFLPSVYYGGFYSGGMILSFISNKLLSQAVSFPIVVQVPGIVGACWDVFFFKTIKGRNNLILLTVAIIVAVVGVVSVGLSR